MKEKIYTIPVNDAFDSACECPICSMYWTLEKDAVAYTMGPSYMEDDLRMQTDELGFCEKHIQQVYNMENRLGFALVMKTHLDKVIAEMEQRCSQPVKGKTIFGKVTPTGAAAYAQKLADTCFVCSRIENTFARYIDTVLRLYKQDAAFRQKYAACKGFCTTHYGQLVQAASEKLSGSILNDFMTVTNQLYLDNMKRVRDDVAWFINKFDYQYADEPWKNAKDSLQRAVIKDNSVDIM